MLKFFKYYASIFSCILGVILLAQINHVFASIIVVIWMLLYALSDQDDKLILLFCIILILGDSRLQFFKPFHLIRSVAISIVFLKSIYDIVKGRFSFEPVIYASLPFFFIAILGIFVSPTPIIAFSKGTSYFFLICICFNYLPYYFLRNRGQLLIHIQYLAIIVLLMGFVFLAVNYDWAFLAQRYRGIMGNPNGLGLISSIMIPFGIIIVNKFPQQKRTGYFLICLAFFSIILSESRTSFGVSVLFFLLYFVYKGGSIRKNLFWFVLLPLIVIIFTTFPIELLVGLVGLEDFLRVESLKTGTGRFMAWGLALVEIQQNLWIGKGFGYDSYFFIQYSKFFVSTEHQGTMHNSYLSFVMNNGILGMIPFVLFLVILFKKIKIKRIGLPFVIIMLISANFESWLNSSLNAFTFFFFMIISILIHYNKINPPR